MQDTLFSVTSIAVFITLFFLYIIFHTALFSFLENFLGNLRALSSKQGIRTFSFNFLNSKLRNL